MVTINKNQLTIPCTYQGGKQRLAKYIIDIIFERNTINKDTLFYDFCCGSGAITIELINRGINTENIIMLDISSWGKFWNEIGKGTFNLDRFEKYINNIPKDKSEIQKHMQDLSKLNANIDEEYIYLLLQASSFGGKQIWKQDNKWCNTSFRNYWLPTETSSRRSPVNPMMPMPDTLLQRIKNIQKHCEGLICLNEDIHNILNRNIKNKNAIIYIDPPYKNTTKYGFNFDIEKFIDELTKKINIPIYVSEGYEFSNQTIKLSKGREKGGISGERKKKANEEWLNIFN